MRNSVTWRRHRRIRKAIVTVTLSLPVIGCQNYKLRWIGQIFRWKASCRKKGVAMVGERVKSHVCSVYSHIVYIIPPSDDSGGGANAGRSSDW